MRESKIDKKKMAKFLRELKKMVRRLGTDDEGDPLVEVDITDRSTHQRMHFLPIPYEEFGPDPERTRAVEYNLRVAYGEWETTTRIAESRAADAESKRQRRKIALEWKAKHGVELCTHDGCHACECATTIGPSYDELGIVHWGRAIPPPTKLPSKGQWRSVVTVRLLDKYMMEYAPDPTDDKKPYGSVIGVSKFYVDTCAAGKIVLWSSPKMVPPILSEAVEEVVNRPLLLKNDFRRKSQEDKK